MLSNLLQHCEWVKAALSVAHHHVYKLKSTCKINSPVRGLIFSPLTLLPEETKGCKTNLALQPLFIRICEQTYSASSATFSTSKAAKSSA